jgi:hypothetical protein
MYTADARKIAGNSPYQSRGPCNQKIFDPPMADREAQTIFDDLRIQHTNTVDVHDHVAVRDEAAPPLSEKNRQVFQEEEMKKLIIFFQAMPAPANRISKGTPKVLHDGQNSKLPAPARFCRTRSQKSTK